MRQPFEPTSQAPGAEKSAAVQVGWATPRGEKGRVSPQRCRHQVPAVCARLLGGYEDSIRCARRAETDAWVPRRGCDTGRAGPSVRIWRGVARRASSALLGLSGAQAFFCLLAGSLELAHACGAGRPLSVGPGLVQVVTLAGVLSLDSQIFKVPRGHGFESRAGVLEIRGLGVPRASMPRRR